MFHHAQNIKTRASFFINFIVDVVSNSMKLFADDTSLYCIVDDQNETAESLNSDLNSLSTWASDWCVNFNVNSIGLVFEALKLTHQSDAQVLRLFKSEFRDSAVSF
jgi:hypothetical protein